jgi:ABC-type lipoprotein export system ATPase subunit
VQEAALQADVAVGPVVRVQVTRRYGEGDTAVTAPNDVSVDIERGKLTAVMGPWGRSRR